MDRKTAILRSANEHFASHGFRGASLRDIARDAQVSLTLLNHHFGSKLDLLRAVIHAHRDVLEQCVAQSRELMKPGAPPLRLDSVVGAWLDVMQAAAVDSDGRHFLRLLGRMVDDPQAEASAVVRGSIEEAALVMMDAVCASYPGATRRQAAIAYLCVTTSMIKCVTAGRRLGQLEVLGQPQSPSEPAPVPAAAADAPPAGDDDGATNEAGGDAEPGSPPPERELLLRFLVGGVEALVRA